MNTWSRRRWEMPNNWARIKGAVSETASRYEGIGPRDEAGPVARLPAERLEVQREANRFSHGRWDS